ncbi:MAG: FG-GAP repeat protein [Chitinophagales bacterium]|nr:FG-GAP repeat protein [Chitinophagales bacterium]
MKLKFIKTSLLCAAVILACGALIINQSDENAVVMQNIAAEPVSLAKTTIKGDVQQNWLEAVQEKIQSASYDFKSSGSQTFLAFNQSHGIRSSVSPQALHIAGNTASRDWDVSLTLQSVETNGAGIEQGEIKKISNSDNKLVYQYENLDVEYINSEKGLRQNFIINEAPEGTNNIAVNLTIESNLNPHVVNNSLVLTHNSIQLYSYSDLKVWDKNGTVLPASMELEGNELALHADVTNAAFPVTIDPLSTTYAWKGTGGQLRAGFGFWICGRGDLNGDGFADVVIGAPEYSNTEEKEGAVFVYYGSASGISETPDWSSFGGQELAKYGRCVSSEGDVNNDGFDDLLIGASEYDAPLKDEGKAFLYLGSEDGLSESYAWTYESNRKSAKFGDAVSIVESINDDDFDDVVIGAKAWDDFEVLGAVDETLASKAGKFWVFEGYEDGLSEIPSMECVGPTTDANLGVSVDGAGDVNGDGYGDINIGGYIFLIGDGMICTFHGGAEGCDNIPDFMAVGGAEDTSFYAVNLSTAGDLNGDGYSDVVIGMPRYDTYGVYNAGKLQIHYGSASGLTPEISTMLGEGQYNERWGYNVNDAGDLNKDGYDDLLVTAKNYSPSGDIDDSVGRGYLFLGSPNGPSPEAVWTFEGESISGVGTNITAAGDVNGDGLDDVLLSGDGYTGDYFGEGAAYLFYGREQVCDAPTEFVTLGVGPTVATFSWDWLYGATEFKVYVKKLKGANAPDVITSTQSSVTVTGLEPSTSYRCYVKAKCQAGWTARSRVITIQTPSGKGTEPNISEVVAMYPNPVSDMLHVRTGQIFGNTTVRIYDAKGNIVLENTYSLEVPETLAVDMGGFTEGVYFVELSNETERVVKKINKAK